MAHHTAEYWIRTLRLEPHPEGGFYRETYRSEQIIHPCCLGDERDARAVCTAIYYLLGPGERSTLHKIRSDELWYFHAGSTLIIHEISPDGKVLQTPLGLDGSENAEPQHMVRAGQWFGAELADANSYGLVSCTVAPGFDFQDFKMGDPKELTQKFPGAAELIRRLASHRGSPKP